MLLMGFSQHWHHMDMGAWLGEMALCTGKEVRLQVPSSQ